MLAGILSVVPDTAMQGTEDLQVTFTLDSTARPPLPPSRIAPTSAEIGTIQGSALTRNNTQVTASIDIPADEAVGAKDVAIYFPGRFGTIAYTLPGGFSVQGSGLPVVTIAATDANAAEAGVDIIYVSNHGGRQLDHCRGSVSTLPEIAEALEGRAQIIVDGAIMRGTDVVKAMALGANAVGIGRLQGLAVAAAGEAGIVRMLEILEEEVRSCLGLLGVTSFNELDRNCVQNVMPLDRTGWSSAFPLIDEGY